MTLNQLRENLFLKKLQKFRYSARRQEAETRLNAAENNLKRADELKKQQQKQ